MWLIPAWLRRAAFWAVGGLAALGGAWVLGKRDASQKAAQDAADDYINTRKRIDESDIGDDPAVLREWLRNRDPKQR